MQKKYLVLLLVIIIGFGTWFLLRPTQTGTSDKTKTDFAIENTESITKIFISNKFEGHVVLEKKNGLWWVNGKYEASIPLMNFFLLETLKKVRVRGPVALPARQNVIASMATLATKVEVYCDHELFKTFYVGSPTSDMSGTYMYLQGSKDPYITHIPGFDGFLSTRFPIAETEWVSKLVFDYQPEDINSVDVYYPTSPNESFTVKRRGNNTDFDITASVNALKGQINYAAVKSYFGMFKNLTCEGFIALKKAQLDSLNMQKPFCEITVIDKKNKVKKLRVYPRESSERDHSLFDSHGNQLTHDPSRFNAFLDTNPRCFVIQDIVFTPVMINYSDFFIKPAK